MATKVDRIGEINYNTFGSKMEVIEYRNYNNIDIYFEEHNWICHNATYKQFKKGSIKCPYERRYYNIGYLGEGKYKVTENGKITRIYRTWYQMLMRCYDKHYHEKYPTYIDCETIRKWHNLQNFGKWYDENYYEIDNEIMCLDKDILHKGNKIYSSENCVFVPMDINNLFVKSDAIRGDCPIGVRYHKHKGYFEANLTINGKATYLGNYKTKEEAFNCYKKSKEKYIKEVADEYKDKIPNKLYEAMYNYEVEIND